MGTMQDQLRNIINTWERNEAQPANQPESNVGNTVNTESAIDTTSTGKLTQFQQVVKIIENNPGITSMHLREVVKNAYPNVALGNLSSILKQNVDAFRLRRTDTGEKNQIGDPIFAYFVVPEDEREAKVAEAKRKAEMVARAAHARAVRNENLAKRRAAMKRAQTRAENKAKLERAKQLELPLEIPVQAPVVAKAPVTEWSVEAALNGLSVLQARALYQELHKIFGN